MIYKINWSFKKEKQKIKQKEYYENNKSWINAYGNGYHKTNKEQGKEAQRKYYLDHKKMTKQQKEYREKLKNKE